MGGKMKQINCDIIRDLIPSYLDGICSEASKDAIKEHLMGCKSCRNYVDSLKSAEIVDEKSDQAGLSFMSKVKKYYTLKNALGASLLLFIVVMVLLFVPQNAFNSVHNTFTFYTTLFTVLILGTFFLLNSYQAGPKPTALRIVAGIAGAAGIVYCIAIAVIQQQVLVKSELRSPEEDLRGLGSSLNCQLLLILLLELLLFVLLTVDAVRKRHHLGILPALNLVGCILSMNYRCLLYMMADPETLALLLTRATVMAAVPGIVTAAIILVTLRLHPSRREITADETKGGK